MCVPTTRHRLAAAAARSEPKRIRTIRDSRGEQNYSSDTIRENAAHARLSRLRETVAREQAAEVRAVEPRELRRGRLVAVRVRDERAQIDARESLGELFLLLGVGLGDVDERGELEIDLLLRRAPLGR